MRGDKWITRLFIGGPWSGKLQTIEENKTVFQVATWEHQDGKPWFTRLISPSRMLLTTYRLRRWRYTFGTIEAMVAEGSIDGDPESKLGEIAKKLADTIIEETQKEQDSETKEG